MFYTGRSKMDSMESLIREHWGDSEGGAIVSYARELLRAMEKGNSSVPRAVRMHTYREIFPCIACYRAISAHGIPEDSALRFMDASWSAIAAKEAAGIRSLLRIPGLYRLYPRIYGYMARHLFGEKAGFRAEFRDCGKHRCRFDMTRCLYLDTCRRFGCPELTVCFCHTDDVKNTDIHPRIGWARTSYMGGGADRCDFDVFVRDKEEE